MAIAAPPKVPPKAEPVTLAYRRFSVGELEQLVDAGILRPGERVELIRGEIVAMAAAGIRHANSVLLTTRILRHFDEAELSVQNDILLPDDTLVLPDFALIRNRDFSRSLPAAKDVLVMVEVSDSSYAYDFNVKLPLYAAAGIPESWLFNLSADRIERYTDPGPVGYQQLVLGIREQTVTSTVFSTLKFATDEVLGPPAGES